MRCQPVSRLAAEPPRHRPCWDSERMQAGPTWAQVVQAVAVSAQLVVLIVVARLAWNHL